CFLWKSCYLFVGTEGGTVHILVIEDDAQVARYVANGLNEHGHLVDHVADGKAGLLKAASDHYDVIVLDRMLPRVDGLTILQTIRATGDSTPVLILSALGEPVERVKGLRSGGDDYLSKPFLLSELIARVEILARRSRASSEETRLSVGD